MDLDFLAGSENDVATETRRANQGGDHPASWIPLNPMDERGPFRLHPEAYEIRLTHLTERPDIKPSKKWLLRSYASQSGVHVNMETATPEQLLAFARWLSFQERNGDLMQLFIRKWPRMEHLLHQTFSTKMGAIAQRHCYICHGARPLDDLFPIAHYVMRITPISRQASRDAVFARFQVAFRNYFKSKTVAPVGTSGKMCMALTFILNKNKRDRDVDNMAKAAQDAFCRAIEFDDRFVHHLDLVKLLFPGTEEWLYIRTAPSFLNEHEDVVCPVHNSEWSGRERIEI